MIKNYLLITLRNFARNRNYTLINILGLSIGISCCLIIFLIVSKELSFDKFHSNYDRIYRVVAENQSASGIEYGTTTPYPFTKAFRNDFPNIPLVTQIHVEEDVLIRVGSEKRRLEYALLVDSLFFDVFDFEVLSGNPRVDLGQPGKVFLTKSLADNLSAGGKNISTIKLNNKIDLEVAGIIADPPSNSHITFSMIVSMPSLSKDFMGFPLDSWGVTVAGYNYIVLPEDISKEKLEEDFGPFVMKYLDKEDAPRKRFKLQPLKDIHFDKQYNENPGKSVNSDMNDLLVMGILGAFILSIACVNFINLATALAIKKSKEIGIRKTLGAKRGQLTFYFLAETFLLTLFSVVISLCAVEWLLRWLNSFLGLSLELNLLTDPILISFILLLIMFTTILAGFYPGIVLSGFNPLAVLKNKITSHASAGAGVRKVLVVFQFIIAQILIMGTLIISTQMDYFKQKSLGFDRDAIVNVPLPENVKEKVRSLKTRLEANESIKNLSVSLGAPTSGNNFSTHYLLSDGAEERHAVQVKPVDRAYLETYGLTIMAGRWFTEAEERAILDSEDPWKANINYIVNESGARRLGFSNPAEIVGKTITTGIRGTSAEVIGVIADFHTTSLHEVIEPVIMVIMPQFYYDAGIKLNTTELSKSITFIERTWLEVFPEYNFEYEFLDDHIAKLYEHDSRTFTLFKVFSGISIFIACLGLYGLISFMAGQRLKEVGIRKVLGASVTSIMVLFSREFVKLILIAFLVAAPLAYYFMNQWLEGFAYRIPMPWGVFIIGVVSTLVIALVTVSFRSAEAARTNPAETLRTE